MIVLRNEEHDFGFGDMKAWFRFRLFNSDCEKRELTCFSFFISFLSQIIDAVSHPKIAFSRVRRYKKSKIKVLAEKVFFEN